MTTSQDQSQITGLLQQWGAGDADALNRLIPILYGRLREIAHFRLQRAPGELSLDTTGLVNEAYLRLVDGSTISVENRNHFFAIASRVMRNVLVDHARARNAAKRSGEPGRVDISETAAIDGLDLHAIVDLDGAMKKLAMINERQTKILEQRYFGGLSLEETAAAMDISLATVKRELRLARAWLAHELSAEADT